MAYEQRDNSGSIFKNKNPKNEKSAPLSGKAMIGGAMYWVNAWSKTDKNGEKWISFSVTPMNPSAEQVQKTSVVDLDSDTIPF